MGVDTTTADFSGWATKAGLKCSDGRTIMPDAFAHMDQEQVPLVWQHGHKNVENILGHAILEHRDGGTYSYAFFNETPSGLHAKSIVQHGDIKNLSIYANQLKERGKSVVHGVIREVSLVLAGANPGAVIDNVALAHGDGRIEDLEDEAIIHTGLEVTIGGAAPADEKAESTKDETLSHEEEVVKKEDLDPEAIFNTLSDEQQASVKGHIANILAGNGDEVQHAEGKSLEEIYNSLNEEQLNVVNYMLGAALSSAAGTAEHSDTGSENDNSDLSHQDNKEGTTIMANAFEGSATTLDRTKPTLTHSQLETIVGNAKRMGSFKDAFTDFIAHATEYGIENIDLLFPEAQALTNAPELVGRRQEWVVAFLNGVRKAPFSRIKSLSADITHEEARAKGYIKGTLKKEEFFALQKRVTTPTTIYKKQKLDRDDVVEITELDVIAWLKAEMRLMLDEEIARAGLLGDGRSMEDEDKVDENCIRPIAHDSDFYTHKVILPANTGGGEPLVEAILRSRPMYRGTGQPTLYCTENLLTDMLLGRDKVGRRYYNSVEELRLALRVAAIVPVDLMEGHRTDNGDLLAVLVNPADYTMGSTRGGQVSMFDDFDIDYNQLKYLIEGRMSGALTKFKSAIAYSRAAGTLVNPTVPSFVPATGVVTIPNQDGVIYRNADSGDALAAGEQPALTAGESVSISAEPDGTHYFPANITTEWTFTRPAA